MGNIDRYQTYKGGKVTEVVVYANYIGLRQFYQYVVNIGRWSPYEGGQLDRFHCIYIYIYIYMSLGGKGSLHYLITEQRYKNTFCLQRHYTGAKLSGNHRYISTQLSLHNPAILMLNMNTNTIT